MEQVRADIGWVWTCIWGLVIVLSISPLFFSKPRWAYMSILASIGTLLVVVLWLRNLHMKESTILMIENGRPGPVDAYRLGVVSGGGGLSMTWQHLRVPTMEDAKRYPHLIWHRINKDDAYPVSSAAVVNWHGFSLGWENNRGYAVNVWSIVVPDWPVALALAITATATGLRAKRLARIRRLVTEGHCPKCLFDLRAHLRSLSEGNTASRIGTKCPECGWPIVPPTDNTPPAAMGN